MTSSLSSNVRHKESAFLATEELLPIHATDRHPSLLSSGGELPAHPTSPDATPHFVGITTDNCVFKVQYRTLSGWIRIRIRHCHLCVCLVIFGGPPASFPALLPLTARGSPRKALFCKVIVFVTRLASTRLLMLQQCLSSSFGGFPEFVPFQRTHVHLLEPQSRKALIC